uniref:O-methyltransferase domain-containing protein n=1 Tax=Bionectria ochroleuca TaxID=29856 RepID=A0A8H7NEE4_BIOOC
MVTADRLESLTQQLAELSAELQGNPEHFKAYNDELTNLAQASAKLLGSIQSPSIYINSMITQMAHFTALRLFIEWGVFDAIPSQGFVSPEDLAKKVKVDVQLITRFSRILLAQGALKQDGSKSLAHTTTSMMFIRESPMNSLIRMGYDMHLKSCSYIVSFFEKYGAKEPQGRLETVFAFACGDPNLTVWEHLNRNQETMKNFMVSMVAMSQRLSITGSYDFSWLLSPKYQERTLIVDVGGGKGHALQAIYDVTPGLPMDRCVVQDLDVVVTESKKVAEGPLSQAQFVASDFHQAQPTKGALIYYIRRCLHDYGDPDCVEILQHIQKSMADDSRLIIAEQIINDQPSLVASATDIYMLTLGGKERTLDGFRAITADAGLEIVEIHGSGDNDLALIECRKF